MGTIQLTMVFWIWGIFKRANRDTTGTMSSRRKTGTVKSIMFSGIWDVLKRANRDTIGTISSRSKIGTIKSTMFLRIWDIFKRANKDRIGTIKETLGQLNQPWFFGFGIFLNERIGAISSRRKIGTLESTMVLGIWDFLKRANLLAGTKHL